MSLPPVENLDTIMRKVARDIAMDIYELDKILLGVGISMAEFMRWETHPRFLGYLSSEREAWLSAGNTAGRTKLKASIVLEDFMEQAHTELHDRKTPLAQRVELSKVLTKIAGIGISPVAGQGAGGGGGFRLQINIAPGVGEAPKSITIDAKAMVDTSQAIDEFNRDMAFSDIDEDEYDPFISPDTLEDA